jgi:putative tricarboxylic transport membrane protein
VKRIKTIAAGAGALFWVAAGLLASYGATRLGLGSVTEPGAGFIFFWSGVILVFLSLIVFAESIRSPADTAREMGEMNWAKIALVLLSLLLYAFFLERLGFILTTFVLVTFLLGCIEDINWFRSLGVASAAALASYAIFELWLKIRLPKGFFGF